MNILERIVAVKRSEIEKAKATVSLREMEKVARSATPPRDFAGALQNTIAAGRPAVIAEIKKASPSRGVLREHFEPASIAKSYEAAGAACLSVLTDRDFFQGSLQHLEAARRACSLPVLRKDFTIDAYQIYEARAHGGDAILLIVACLQPGEMRDLETVAMDLGMSVLVEVHDEAELQKAAALRTPLIGINNRDLRTFETKLDTTLKLLDQLPRGRLVITESGILSSADVALMRANKVDAFLVGEAFMKAADAGGALHALFFDVSNT